MLPFSTQLVVEGRELGDALTETLACTQATDDLAGIVASLQRVAGQLLPVVEDDVGKGLVGGDGEELGGEAK